MLVSWLHLYSTVWPTVIINHGIKVLLDRYILLSKPAIIALKACQHCHNGDVSNSSSKPCSSTSGKLVPRSNTQLRLIADDSKYISTGSPSQPSCPSTGIVMFRCPSYCLQLFASTLTDLVTACKLKLTLSFVKWGDYKHWARDPGTEDLRTKSHNGCVAL